MTEGRSMVNPSQWVDSARDNGYKNAAMAIGELIDNSLQAGASKVEVLVGEQHTRVNTRRVWQVKEIGILDNGVGMDADLLERSLVFGESDNRMDSDGMGKFGVGLPQASISQAQRIDVWSWVDGGDPKHVFIDLSDPEWVKVAKIRPADDTPLPPHLTPRSGLFEGRSGTLVLWTNLDRLTWTKASTLYENAQHLVGRMYRNWLTAPAGGSPKAVISQTAFDVDGREERDAYEFVANDPLYLLPGSAGMDSTTGRNVLFERWGEPTVRKYGVPQPDGTFVDATVRCEFSLATKESGLREPFDGLDAGHLDYGKHAKSNQGVSILRAGRELDLETKFLPDKDARNRWWGASVEFPPVFDAVFGVTNNKQRAERLSELSRKEWSDFSEGGETDQQVRERLEEEDPALFIALDVVSHLRNHIDLMFKQIKKTGTSSKSGRTRHTNSPEVVGTGATIRRQQAGHDGTSDEEESSAIDERRSKLTRFLADIGADDSEGTIGDLVDHNLKYSFAHAPLESDAFFTVEPIAGKIVITLNKSHVAHGELFDTLQQDTSEMTPQQLQQQIMKANSALMLMIIAWSRFEDESNPRQKMMLKDTRGDWGRMARDFLLFGKED
jgi:hypothetical protein